VQRDARGLLAARHRDPNSGTRRHRQTRHHQAGGRLDPGGLRRAPALHLRGDTAPGQANGNNLNLNGGLWHEVPASGQRRLHGQPRTGLHRRAPLSCLETAWRCRLQARQRSAYAVAAAERGAGGALTPSSMITGHRHSSLNSAGSSSDHQPSRSLTGLCLPLWYCLRRARQLYPGPAGTARPASRCRSIARPTWGRSSSGTNTSRAPGHSAGTTSPNGTGSRPGPRDYCPLAGWPGLRVSS
jgi:hypothetical protein